MYLKHYLAHELDPIVVKRLVEKAFRHYQERYPAAQIAMAWTGEQSAAIDFAVRGVRFKGALKLLPRSIELGLEVPWALRVFQRRALRVIDQEAGQWLARARAENPTAPAGTA